LPSNDRKDTQTSRPSHKPKKPGGGDLITKEVLERINRLLSFDTTRTAQKTKKFGEHSKGTHTDRSTDTDVYTDRHRWIYSQQGDPIHLFLFFENNEVGKKKKRNFNAFLFETCFTDFIHLMPTLLFVYYYS
jgi:hypothetical protein